MINRISNTKSVNLHVQLRKYNRKYHQNQRLEKRQVAALLEVHHRNNLEFQQWQRGSSTILRCGQK